MFLVAFFSFFHLALLLPVSSKKFDKTRYLTLGDVILGQLGVHVVMTCAKNIQPSGQFQVVQLALLKKSALCPVLAIKSLIEKLKLSDKMVLYSKLLQRKD